MLNSKEISHYNKLFEIGKWTVRWQGSAALRSPLELRAKTDLGMLYGVCFMLTKQTGTRVLQIDRPMTEPERARVMANKKSKRQT